MGQTRRCVFCADARTPEGPERLPWEPLKQIYSINDTVDLKPPVCLSEHIGNTIRMRFCFF